MKGGLIMALIMMAGPSVLCQTASGPPIPQKDSANQTSAPTDQTKKKSPDPSKQTAPAAKKKPKRGELVIAPIPISSPAIGSGLVLVAGYVFKLNTEDKRSPKSVVGLAAAFTNNGSRGGGIGGRLYFKENTYQTTFVFAKGRVDFDFFGIGRIPGRAAISVPLRMDGTVFFGEFLRNVGKDIFVGARYQNRSIKASLEGLQPPGGFEIPVIDVNAKSVAIGIHVQRDKRDSNFYPTTGSLFNWHGDFFDQAWGSRRQYQTYKLSYSGYHKIKNKQVLAYQAMTCSANGNVPFYDLCFFGTNNDLRGYTGGEFQNRRMFATQAEYRLELKKRLGLVAFAGVGGVAKRWNEFRSDQLLPAAGAGLRFTLDKKDHINYRVDWAVGRAGHTLTIGIGEAF